jgi:hypothetical protein
MSAIGKERNGPIPLQPGLLETMMNRIRISLLSLVLLLGLSAVCQAAIKEQYSSTETFPVPTKAKLIGSYVLGSESTEDACEEGEKDFFDFKGTTAELNALMNKVTVIETWERLTEIRRKYFESPLLNKIRETDFSGYTFAIVLTYFTGGTYFKNGRLHGDNHRMYFSYEVWVKQLDLIPACAWMRLYVLKLKK